MTFRFANPVFIWFVLVSATMLSYASWLSPGWANTPLGGSSVIAIAGAKAWLIGMRYMEIDRAKWQIKLVFNLWIGVVTTMLITMFWQA